MNVRTAIHFASAAFALAALALGATATAADTIDPVADAKAFRRFFTQ
jgi:sulfur-oxidizing protein SoxA